MYITKSSSGIDVGDDENSSRAVNMGCTEWKWCGSTSSSGSEEESEELDSSDCADKVDGKALAIQSMNNEKSLVLNEHPRTESLAMSFWRLDWKVKDG
jgi:hypothetical protein